MVIEPQRMVDPDHGEAAKVNTYLRLRNGRAAPGHIVAGLLQLEARPQ
jgi:hypothetical protein